MCRSGIAIASAPQMPERARRKKPSGTLRHFVRMGCPDVHGLRVSLEDIIRFADLDLDRAVAAAVAGVHASPEFRGNDMEAEADAEHGEAEVQVLRTVARPRNVRPAAKDDPAALLPDPCSRGGIGDQGHINVQVPQRPVDEVVELPEVVDHVDGKHCSP